MDLYVRRMTLYLVDEAKKIIEKARRTKQTKNQSGTQWDSFGAIVFYNGSIKYTLKNAEPGTDLTKQTRYMESIWDENQGRHRGHGSIPPGTGREWAEMFAKEIKGSHEIPKQGFCLIIFNAAFYSKVQEEGGGRLKRPYKIISQIAGDMYNLKSKFQGAEVRGYHLNNI